MGKTEKQHFFFFFSQNTEFLRIIRSVIHSDHILKNVVKDI